MGHVNEGGMHFIHYGNGIEKKEFEFDNKYVSSNKKKSTDHPKTVFYKGKICKVVSVEQVKSKSPNKKVSPKILNESKCAIGYKVFRDITGNKYICVLLMHKIFKGFTLDSFQRYVLRVVHSFKTVDVLIEVAIKKDQRMPVRIFAERAFIEISKNACWVAACIPIPESKSMLIKEKGKYRIDHSVSIDSGIEVRYQLALCEEEFYYTFVEKEDLWRSVRYRDVEKLFSLPGFDNYCEKL